MAIGVIGTANGIPWMRSMCRPLARRRTAPRRLGWVLSAAEGHHLVSERTVREVRCLCDALGCQPGDLLAYE
ncbi:helix-turn-helix domain-containing protein [Nonomuraea sp. CA-141351]|uniref:helix-turn-helix domain-containing protein n=1 Tax=Nonomuraea sp. CA-141351 TaxID=3239996 RepID=UPI003D8B97E7